MKKSAFILDILFTISSVSLVTLCLFRYLGASFPASIALCLPCGGLAGIAVWALLQSKRNACFLKKQDAQIKQKLFLHLALSSDEQVTRLFQDAYAKTQSVKKLGKLKLQTDTETVWLRFTFAPVCADEIAVISRISTNKPKMLVCNELEENAARLCQRLGILVKTGDETYLFLKNADALPTNFLGEEQAHNKKIRRKIVCFSKRNARRFFVGGALVLLTSLFTPFPYYYLVLGSILLAVALFVRIFGYS